MDFHAKEFVSYFFSIVQELYPKASEQHFPTLLKGPGNATRS